ncbi:Transposable element Tcb1 [Brachionus plicatilis]|uniref:Transposable element Tcb1 n=1 Tax=Brachionus plicatilis TaxID=10195 RepID=A0A3M7PST3_BRAPC|nr:Transposable element Tcb1 [Brachionus plicatilis]
MLHRILINWADLNPIENLWSYIDAKLVKTKLTSIEHLKSTLLKEWLNVPDDYVKKLIESMPKRIRACYDAKGEINKQKKYLKSKNTYHLSLKMFTFGLKMNSVVVSLSFRTTECEKTRLTKVDSATIQNSANTCLLNRQPAQALSSW